MLQVARLAPNQLLDAADLVRDFLLEQIDEDGGFKNRAGVSDLYYTVFGIESLLALQAEIPEERLTAYVRTYGDGEGLDFVHLGCLARCDAALGRQALSDAERETIRRRLEEHRLPNGSYGNDTRSERGTIYGCFLSLGAHQDLGLEHPDPEGLGDFVRSMETPDGGYSNEAGMPVGSTPATAAAVTLLRQLGFSARSEAGAWLTSRWNPDGGGFFAVPAAPMPDLLSTATALHALSGLEQPVDALKDSCLDFIDTLWTKRGSFFGHWADQDLDCEYTYYALLALGHLTVLD